MLNLIVATQSLVLEASNTMVFFMSKLLKYTVAKKVAKGRVQKHVLVPQNAGNAIYTFKIFRGSMPLCPLAN